jgi:transcription antitermination protein NusB
MISRRNIRVKVMQTLYTLSATEPENTELAIYNSVKVLNEKLSDSLELFSSIILYISSIAQYAETDSRVRLSKYLLTESDKNVNTKIAGNDFIWKTISNETFQQKVAGASIQQNINEEWVKKLYQQLAQTPEYIAYTEEQSRDPKSEKAIIRFIWTDLMLKNEEFLNYLHDELNGWEDDKDMAFILMDNFFKNNANINYMSLLSAEKNEYAKTLLKTVIEKADFCMSLIEPKLINWEADRVALIDLILLRMGVCELLFFPSIPTKVTINEYIEIAKTYSTPQSGHFVNAVLDNILKDLEKDKKIQKQDRITK